MGQSSCNRTETRTKGVTLWVEASRESHNFLLEREAMHFLTQEQMSTEVVPTCVLAAPHEVVIDDVSFPMTGRPSINSTKDKMSDGE